MTGRFEWRRVLRRFFVIIFSALFCALFFPAPLPAAETLRVSIPDTVWFDGTACALSEIADIEGPRDYAERVGALLLSIESGVITRSQVIGVLKVSGLEGARVELRMPETVRVEAGEPPEDLPPRRNARGGGDSAAGDLTALVKSLAAWDGDVEVKHQGEVPEGRLTAPASLVPGTSAATLKFRDAAGRERSLAVRLEWYQPALVLLRSVKRGEVLKESDFTVRRLRVTKPGVYASRVSEAAGRSLRKDLSQGEAVALNLITGAPIIERGKSVIIIARSAGLTVKAKGEALENGALGEAIKVRNSVSKMTVTAVVVDSNTVEVKMP